MHLRLVFVPLVLLTLAGCAVTKIPLATGGSRSDGTVQMAYEYGLFEVPQVDWDRARVGARQRCQAWDYSEAEPFGGSISHCEERDSSGNCLRTLVSMTYQCTGRRPVASADPGR